MSTVAYIGPMLSLEILGEPRGERELLEMRMLHEQQHLVHSERWPVPKNILKVGLSQKIYEISGLFRRQTHSHCAQCAFSVDVTNAHSMSSVDRPLEERRRRHRTDNVTEYRLLVSCPDPASFNGGIGSGHFWPKARS